MRYSLKDLSIDTEARTVCRGNQAIKLPELSFTVLAKLLDAAPHAVDNSEFSRSVWHNRIVSDETLAQRITLIRKALGDNPKNPQYIRTVRGVGYSIVGLVESDESQSKPFFASLTKPVSLAMTAAAVSAVFLLGYVGKVENQINSPIDVVSTAPKSSNLLLLERAQEQLQVHQARETDRALSMLRQLLSFEPENYDARLTLSFALSTKATKFGGGIEEKREAEALARTLLTERPENSNAWSALAYSLDSQGRIHESLPAYQTAYQLNPNNTPAISSAAYLHLNLGNLHQALLLENRAKQKGGSSRYAEIQIAQNLELIGHTAAYDWHKKALSINPGQIVIISEIAKSFLRQGDPISALEVLSLAEAEEEVAPQVLQLSSRAALMLGDSKRAQELLESAGSYGNFDAVLLKAASGENKQARELLIAKLAKLETVASSADLIQLAELAAVLGESEKASMLVFRAIDLGWRDTNWLKNSPYLGTLMSSTTGNSIEDTISQKLNIQRRLIEQSEELVTLINS